MPPAEPARVGYVVKWYPRLSETFIVNEILAHEAAGLDIEIFSLRAPVDSRFHESLGRVRSQVTYIPVALPRVPQLWSELSAAAGEFDGLWAALDNARGDEGADVYQALCLARAARERGVTHLHAHFASLPGTVTRIAAAIAGLPYSITAHAKDIFHESVDHAAMGRRLREAADVVTVSDYNLEYLRTTYGEDARGVRRIYNGLDLETFPYTAPHERAPLVVGVGRLIEKKGFADLIDACGLLAGRGRMFTCRIIGGGLLQDELAARIEARGLGDRVSLLGAQPHDVVRAHLRDAAMLAAPCVVGGDGNRDGLPTVLLEAMALGTPCISTDVTGIPEAIRHDVTGLMAAQHDPASLADCIDRLLGDRTLALRLAAGARRLVEERFDIHQNAAEIRRLFTAGRERAALVPAGAR